MRRRTFSREYKIEAVKLLTERGVSVAQACRDLDVAKNVFRRWLREAAAAPASAFPGNDLQRDELAALKKEVAKLKAECDSLKKAAAYFAREAT
jgi:transposase